MWNGHNKVPRLFYIIVNGLSEPRTIKMVMTQTVNIGQMIQDELNKIDHSAAWLAKKLNNSRTNGHKIIHEKKYNDVLFLIDVSIITGHNFLQDLADITTAEIKDVKKREKQ